MRKSIKHLFGLTLGVSLALGLISSASAEGSVSVQVDGKTVQSAAYIDQNDRTMVSPDIADALGLTQKQEGSRVQFTRNGVSTYFTGSDATFSGSEMDTVPALRDGTLYVPLAYLAQALGHPVAIVDINDLGANILGCSQKEPSMALLARILGDNPLGQSSECTPMGIIRKV